MMRRERDFWVAASLALAVFAAYLFGCAWLGDQFPQPYGGAVIMFFAVDGAIAFGWTLHKLRVLA
jgi:hypothetical protein